MAPTVRGLAATSTAARLGALFPAGHLLNGRIAEASPEAAVNGQARGRTQASRKRLALVILASDNPNRRCVKGRRSHVAGSASPPLDTPLAA